MKYVWAIFLFFYSLQTRCMHKTGEQKMLFELGGASIASFNYDMRFTKNQNGIGGRVGFGGVKIDNEGAIFIPIGLNYLFGNDGKNYFELGAGVTYLKSTNGEDTFVGDVNTSFGHFSFGYRYQPSKNGFLFKAAITPIFAKGLFFPYYAGVAFGYKF
jgi:hypothetical protein